MAFDLLLKNYTIEEIKISLYEPVKEAVAESFRKGLIAFPYWSQVWPAAIALARFLQKHPYHTRNKKVLELAAGLGLPSFIAAANAHSVLASDYAPAAVAIMQQTITYNHLQNTQVQLLDWHALPTHLFAEILLLSDVSYDAALFTVQEKVIRRFLEKRATVIISTPQRLIAKDAVMPLLSFCIHQEEIMVTHNSKEVAITVMVLKKG